MNYDNLIVIYNFSGDHLKMKYFIYYGIMVLEKLLRQK